MLFSQKRISFLVFVLLIKFFQCTLCHVLLSTLLYMQTIKLSSVAKKCQNCRGHHTYERSFTFKEWYLNNVPNVVPDPNFQCYINLDVCKKDKNICKVNTIPIDDLDIGESGYRAVKKVWYM